MLLTREQLQERLFALHAASLELVKDVSLETLLERIASTACEQVGARYGALGVLDDDGKLERFIAVGMSESEIKRIAHPPVGLGLIGGFDGHERAPARAGHPGPTRVPSAFPTIIPTWSHFWGCQFAPATSSWGRSTSPINWMRTSFHPTMR
ncbi:MAG: GAF domain-containing protein [Chloroflexi bacterium]|nr:GAF domain-containing protein [Chloroflexota bacterium]